MSDGTGGHRPPLQTTAAIDNDGRLLRSGPPGRRCSPYPPGKQEKATRTVLEQAELLGVEWAS